MKIECIIVTSLELFYRAKQIALSQCVIIVVITHFNVSKIWQNHCYRIQLKQASLLPGWRKYQRWRVGQTNAGSKI